MAVMRTDVLIYMAGPITPRDGYLSEDNVASALRVYLDAIRRGLPAFCPQLSAAFPSAFSEVPYEQWLEYDLCIINRCTHLLLLPRAESSPGAQRERNYAQTRGIPVITSLDEVV